MARRNRTAVDDVLDKGLRPLLKELGFKRKTPRYFVLETQALVKFVEIEPVHWSGGGPEFLDWTAVRSPLIDALLATYLDPPLPSLSGDLRHRAHDYIAVHACYRAEREAAYREASGSLLHRLTLNEFRPPPEAVDERTRLRLSGWRLGHSNKPGRPVC